MYQRFVNYLQEVVDARVLGLFRIVYGLFMLYYCFYYYKIQYIKQGLLAPIMQFKYEGFEWVQLLPEPVMNGILGLMTISAVLITVGWLFRWACIVYALGLGYFFMLEKAYYNNHIYLFILMFILLAFTNADKVLSVISKKEQKVFVARWQVFILQLQIAIVYFYGGLAKLTYDWLVQLQPMKTLVGGLTGEGNAWAAYLLSYGGVLLDLFAPIMLFIKPLRNWVILPLALFHFTNSQIFDDIGIFPYVMLATMILFFDSQELPWWRKGAVELENHSRKRGISTSISSISYMGKAWYKPALMCYFIFQLLFPFRGYFLPNKLDYSTIGNRFSWRMKVDTRSIVEMEWSATHAGSTAPQKLDLSKILNPMQINLLMVDPRASLAFANHIKKEAVKRGLKDPQVLGNVKIRYNGGEPHYFIGPNENFENFYNNAFEKVNRSNF
jgi:vitamin K-dependent gamma-carboxylase